MYVSNVGISNVLTNVVCLFHEKEQEDNGTSAKDTGPVEDPLPSLILGNKSTYDGGKVVATSKEECVEAHVGSSFVREVLSSLAPVSENQLADEAHHINYTGLWESFNRSSEETKNDVTGNPLTVSSTVRT